jgi:hypothetical protein
LTPSEVREAKVLLYDLRTAVKTAGATTPADPQLEGLQCLSEGGVPLTVTPPERRDSGFDRMTPAAQALLLDRRGIPMKEGSYTTVKNGEPVEVALTDDDTLQAASDMYQLVDHEYNGSPSIEATRLEGILQHLHAGMPLDATEHGILRDLETKYAAELAEWRGQGQDGQDARLPETTGRVAATEDTTREAMRAAGIPMREAVRPAHETARLLDQLLPGAHPDRAKLAPIVRAGAAVSGDQRTELSELAEKHRGLLDGGAVDGGDDSDAPESVDGLKDAEDADDVLEGAGAPLGEAEARQALAAGGIPVRA